LTVALPRPTTERSGELLASYVGFTVLAWYLNALGAVLPPLRDDVGQWAGAYPLFPGAVLFAWGMLTLARTGRAKRKVRVPGIAVGFVVLSASIGLMGITGWPSVSVIGALVGAVAAGQVNRALPAKLAMATFDRPVEPVMMRANAFSSVAAIVAPLAVGGSLAIGAGWQTGYVVPVAIGAVLVCALALRAPKVEPIVEAADLAPVPPFRTWWRPCAVLAVAIVVEFCFAFFAVTFLHEERGLSKSAAAAGGAAWGIGMAIGRFVFSVRRPPVSILPSAVVILAGFLLFWTVPNAAVAIVGIGVAGLGTSPLYPSRITLLIERFPGATHEGSKRAALAPGCALLVAPALMVSLRAASDVRTAYLAVPVLLVILVVLARPGPWPRDRSGSTSPPESIGL
jgi:hypothetical protein